MFIDNHDLVLMAQKSGEAIVSLASLSPTPLGIHIAHTTGSYYQVCYYIADWVLSSGGSFALASPPPPTLITSRMLHMKLGNVHACINTSSPN